MRACGGNLGLIGVKGSTNSGKSSTSSVGISKFSGWKMKTFYFILFWLTQATAVHVINVAEENG